MLFIRKPHYVTIVHALFLIVLGLFAFFTHQDFPDSPPWTALIGPGVGVVLLAMTPGMKSQNKVVAHIVVLLTFLFALATGQMMAKRIMELNGGEVFDNRAVVIFAVWTFIGLTATVLYVMNFLYNKKIRKAIENDPSV